MNQTNFKHAISIISFCFALLLIIVPFYNSFDDTNSKIYFYIFSAAIWGIFSLPNTKALAAKITFIDGILISIFFYTLLYQLISESHVNWNFQFRIIASFIFFVTIKNWGFKTNLIDGFINFLLLLGTLEVFIIVLELSNIVHIYPNSYYKINGVFGNPNIVALFIALLFPLVFYKIERFPEKKYFFIILLFIFLSAIILCKCRSAIVLSLFPVVGAIWRLPIRKKIIAGSIISVVFTSVIVAIWIQKVESSQSRILIWSLTSKMITEKPFTGFGIDAFEKEYNLYQGNYLATEKISEKDVYSASYIRQPYNEFFYFWASGGFLLLLLFLFLLGFPVWMFLKISVNQDNLTYYSILVLCGVCFISLFSYTIYVTIIEFLFFFYLGIVARNVSSLRVVNLSKKMGPVVLGLLLFMGVYSAKQIKADYEISKVRGDIDILNQVEVFRGFSTDFKTNPQFLFNYAIVLLKNREIKTAIEVLEQAKNYSSYYQIYHLLGKCYELNEDYPLAEFNYKIATKLYPAKFLPAYSLFKFYQKHYRFAEAVSVAIVIDKKPVRKNSVEIERIKKGISQFLTLNINNNEKTDLQ